MAARTILSLALVAVICSLASGANKCYRCGYQKMGDGPPTALPGMPECGDQATLQDNQVDCTGDDCCGSIREWLEMVDNDTGEKKELLIGRHDCEQDLEGYAKYDVLCSDHTDECVDVDLDSLPQGHNETMLRAKICFCSGPLCNFHVPGLETTLEPEPTQPTAAGKQCYNCGYRKLPNGEVEKLPDTAECNDFATPDDITVNCPNDDDCCGSMKESFTKIDETTNETSTVIIGRHGCESDLNHVGEQTVLCSDHTDSCFNIDKASLPDHTDHNVTVTDIELCFCSGDRCNAEDPIFPEPTKPTTPQPTQPAGAASSVVSSIVVLILAFLC